MKGLRILITHIHFLMLVVIRSKASLIHLSRSIASRPLVLLLCLPLIFLAGCQGNSATTFDLLRDYDPERAYYPAKQWSKVASPELAGWSSLKLEQAEQYSRSIHSAAVVIVENGVVIADWGNVTIRYKLHSVRKSIMSVMYGIAVDIDQINLSATLEDLAVTDKGGLSPAERRATIHDLLTSRSGVYHPAVYETSSMREKRPPRGSHEPGTFWYYNNWDFNVLRTIYQNQTGNDFFRHFEEKIALPLRMEQFRLQDTTYHYDSEFSVHPAYLFRMSALDLARFGLLCLREGRWQEQQIVSAEWMHRSTQPYTVFNPKHPARGYGYLWWLDKGMFYASGTGGQRLFVIPDYDLVIVHRTDTDSKVRIKSRPIWKLVELILQARSPEEN